MLSISYRFLFDNVNCWRGSSSKIDHDARPNYNRSVMFETQKSTFLTDCTFNGRYEVEGQVKQQVLKKNW